jgi:hypothetical protein
MFSLVKEYLATHRVAITYVHDPFGYKCGCVVAIGRDKIGFSQVHRRHDYYPKDDLQVHQLPAIQRQMQRIRDGLTSDVDIFHSKAYTLYMEHKKENDDWCAHALKIPHFDREAGLMRAIEMAENGTFDVESWMAKPWQKPLNFAMRESITNMIERSHLIRAFNA